MDDLAANQRLVNLVSSEVQEYLGRELSHIVAHVNSLEIVEESDSDSVFSDVEVDSEFSFPTVAEDGSACT